MEKEKLITLPLVDLPTDVNKIIRNEQLRIELHEEKKLKKEHVVFKIVREWNFLKHSK
jgi:hypothetical protein